jgi:uncharacterized protein YidB (DUF937 family)
MGLLDQITGLFGGDTTKALDGIKNLVDPNGPLGGLSGLESKFEAAGLGDTFRSWVSRGENQSISPAQIKQAIPAENLQNLAQNTGLSLNDASSKLSELLPQVIDKLTPDGSLPAASEVTDKIGDLKSLIS